MAAEKNPIERRLERLTEQWEEFTADADARLLRWLVARDELSMIDLFVRLQDEEASEIPDLFLRFEEPFPYSAGGPITYGRRLAELLEKQVDESRPELEEDQTAADWKAPEPRADTNDVALLRRVCESFQAHYSELVEHLVLVLVPSEITDLETWQRWLLYFLRCELPEPVRVMVIDLAEAPQLEWLCGNEPERIRTVEPELDMANAPQEVAEEAGGEGPGVDFRHHLLALNKAAGQGDLAAVGKHREAALEIAGRERWWQMQLMVRMSAGTAYLNAGESRSALEDYRAADEVAAAAAEDGQPEGVKLRIQARFAIAATLVREGEFERAAEVYESVVPLTETAQEPLMLLESWRMASYCHEVSKKDAEAWRCGHQGLAAGELLDEDQRAASTLPYLGQGLLRLVERQWTYKRQEDELRRRLVELLGKGWEEKLDAETAP